MRRGKATATVERCRRWASRAPDRFRAPRRHL